MFSGMFMVFLLLLSPGQRDLLDLVPSDAYWESKNVPVSVESMRTQLAGAKPADVSKSLEELGSVTEAIRKAARAKILAAGPAAADQLRKAKTSAAPEVADEIDALLKQLAARGKEPDVRRLMAIRALGELKDPAALADLKPFADSKDMFVADYAARAISQLEKKPASPATRPAAGKDDYLLLPANTAVVAHVGPGLAENWTLDKLLQNATPPRWRGNIDPKQARAQVARQLITLAEAVGNVRLDSLTLGISDDIGTPTGSLTLIAAGQYDAQAVAAAIERAMGPRGTSDKKAPFPVVRFPDGAFLFPSNSRLVVVAGPPRARMSTENNAEDGAPAVAAAIAALKANKGQIATNKPMLDLAKTADATAPLWAVARIADSYRQVPFLAPFDTLRLAVTFKDNTLHTAFDGQGKDPAAIKTAVDFVNNGIAEGVQEFQRPGHAAEPSEQALLRILQSITAAAKDQAATLTASANDADLQLILGSALYMVIPTEAFQRPHGDLLRQEDLP